MFGVETDQVCIDPIKIGDTLTYKQAYNFAKMEESTIAQMEVLSINPRDKTLINKIKCSPGQTAMTRSPKHNSTQNKNQASGQPNLPEAKNVMDMEETTNKETNVLLEQHSAGTVSMHKKKQLQLHEVRDQEEY